MQTRRTMLTLDKELKIIDWIRGNKQKLDNKVNLQDACDLIEKDLTIKLNYTSLRRICEMSGVTWNRPFVRSINTEGGKKFQKQITVLVDAVMQLYRECGSSPSTELQILKRYIDAENAATKVATPS